MEHVRCARCRNPIRGRQASVRHAPSATTFHADCWSEMHAHAQQDYARTVESQDVLALLLPYSRRAVATWLPQQESDEVDELASVDAPVADQARSPETV